LTSTIRKAGPGDIPLLVDLMQEFHREGGRPLDREWAAASFSALFRDESRGAAWIVSCDGGPAGYVVLTVRFTMEFGGLDAFIDDLFVRPDFRRRGLGRLVVAALFAECERRGVLAVHVETGSDNIAAKGLYESFGLRLGNDGRQMLTVALGGGAAGAA
jgi:ribosomal protein S18 acetylase RimI-like enzyme